MNLDLPTLRADEEAKAAHLAKLNRIRGDVQDQMDACLVGLDLSPSDDDRLNRDEEDGQMGEAA